MTVTLLMAISVNGFIAGENDDTNWVKDLAVLNKSITNHGVVVMGRRTYEECLKFAVFPYKNALNIVMTADTSLQNNNSDIVIFTEKNPTEIISFIEERGFKSMLVIGGGHINSSFLKSGLISEIILDVHPQIITRGIHLFEGDYPNLELQFVSSAQINDQIVQLIYKLR